MHSSAVRLYFQSLCLIFVILRITGGQVTLTVTPDRDTTFNITRVRGSSCTVCLGKRHCSLSLVLTTVEPVSVRFTCPKPQEEFRVEILKTIVCSSKSCNGHIFQTDSGSLPFIEFNRTFTWNLKASLPTAVKIDFSKTSLKQIKPYTTCPDAHTYTLQAFHGIKMVAIGTYCRGGSITGIQVLNQSQFSLYVSAKRKLEPALFDVSVGEAIKMLAKIKLSLPEGTSSTELLSPNYPDAFPDHSLMEWDFQVLPKHNTTVSFLKYTQPQCLKKQSAGVEYHYNTSRGTSILRLGDTQPGQRHGNFSLTLKNCETDQAKSGLSLHFKVSAIRTSFPVLCSVDLRKQKGFALSIKKIRAGCECELKINSKTTDTIALPPDTITQLSFQDCPPEDIQVIAKRVIACQQLRDCPKVPMQLVMPVLPSCLPAPVSSVTWTLTPPLGGTVELLAPSGGFSQDLPGQTCNDSIIFKLAENDERSLGQFCPQGVIQKIQSHTNMSVTTVSTQRKRLLSSPRTLLSFSFRDEISERYIFTVAPKKGIPVLLATPSWPAGMKFYSTISWVITVPPKMEAHLMFVNLSQPKCREGHTNIRVQMLGSLEEMYSRREDEEADSEVSVSKSFYLNMSNCMPDRGNFSVITKITLQKNKNLLLTFILSAVAALLVIMGIILVAVCLVIRKKKKMMNHQVSIYNPNGTEFLPGQNGGPKSDEESEYHIYDSIEDTLVYTHLLKREAEVEVYGEADVYRPFTGPSEPHKPPHNAGSVTGHPKVSVYQSFVPASQQAPTLPNRPPSQPQLKAPPMVDNDLYSTETHAVADQDLTRHPEQGLRPEPEGGH